MCIVSLTGFTEGFQAALALFGGWPTAGGQLQTLAHCARRLGAGGERDALVADVDAVCAQLDAVLSWLRLTVTLRGPFRTTGALSLSFVTTAGCWRA